MADIGDEAQRTSDIFLDAALRKRTNDTPAFTGRCLFCAEALPSGHRWCDADCRSDWDREQRARRHAPVD